MYPYSVGIGDQNGKTSLHLAVQFICDDDLSTLTPAANTPSQKSSVFHSDEKELRVHQYSIFKLLIDACPSALMER